MLARCQALRSQRSTRSTGNFGAKRGARATLTTLQSCQLCVQTARSLARLQADLSPISLSPISLQACVLDNGGAHLQACMFLCVQRGGPFEGRSARTLFQKTVVGERAYLLGQCLLSWFQSLPMRGSFVASVAPRLVRVSVDSGGPDFGISCVVKTKKLVLLVEP